MHAETSSISTRSDLLWSEQADQYRDIVWRTVREARTRAQRIGQPILAAVTRQVEHCEPLDLFTASTHETTGFYWERPYAHLALAGVGTAAIIEANGVSGVLQVSLRWHEMLQQAVFNRAGDESQRIATSRDGQLPPLEEIVAFGGFAFDPLAPHTARWDGFPGGLLILPRLSLRRHSDNITLTLNRLIAPGDDIEFCVNNMLRDLAVGADSLSGHPFRGKGNEEFSRPGVGWGIPSDGEFTPPPPGREITSPPERLSAPTQEAHFENVAGESVSMQDILPAQQWMDIVAGAVADIHHGDYKKVMLGREMQVTREDGAFDIDVAVRHLSAAYPTSYVFALRRGARFFVGATPEQLVSVAGGQLRTMALAGTVPRGQTAADDARFGAELLASAKNREEHQIVVETMRASLSELCTHLDIQSEPHLLKLKNVQHLETLIRGQLLPELSILDAVACLHPTPAVGGFPREAAVEKIRRAERLDRGWWAGPVGWIDAGGNGEFAVALRSALVKGNEAVLFAGCGIVADSEPKSEYAESCLKAQVMLRALAGSEGQ